MHPRPYAQLLIFHQQRQSLIQTWVQKKDRSGVPLGDLRASDDGTVGEDGRCLDNELSDGVSVRNALCCVAGVVFRSTGIL